MSTPSSSSKRKRRGRPNIGDFLHPGEWGHKRSRSGSPSAPGASTTATDYSNIPTPSNYSSRDPSPTGRLGPSVPSHRSPDNSASTLVPPPSNTVHQTPLATTSIPDSTRNSTGGAWTGLEQALRALRLTTKICPSLSLAAEDLTSCLPMFEVGRPMRHAKIELKCKTSARPRQKATETTTLATGLKGMVDQLIRHLSGTTSESIIDTITGIAEAIRKEIESITMHQSHSLPRRLLGASTTEDDLIRRYRRIEQLFRQLQGEASMSTWNTVDELRVDQQLKDLLPSKLARFNSELSTEVSRRGCTKHTRTTILEESMAWSEDPAMAKVYWMNGMAGTGKTTIAYSVCERLETGKQLAASFFCTRASPECREAKRIIPTIAYQLARRFLPFRYSLCQQLKKDPDISTGQLSDQFDLLLKKPLLAAKDKLSNNLVVVVDALDECSDPHIVELFLDLLFRSVLELPIKFFVTSRPEPAIRNKMMPESERSRSILYLHEIELSLVQADIELYLREELASIAPADEDITELAEHAGNLFIYAATAVRYVRPVGKAVNSKARLKAILALSAESSTTLSAIDTLYTTILTAAINDEDLSAEEQNQIRLVLQTAVCACEPIRTQTLSMLSGLGDKDDTIAALQPLRSVLHVSEHSGLVTTLHASFPDFMFSQARSGTFHCDKVVHSQAISTQCFNVMRDQLRFNICSIQSSFIPNAKIPKLEEQITTNISEELFYTCRFWMDHLSETDLVDTSLLLANELLSERLLFWMELNTWLTQAHLERPDLLELASDAQAFVANYASSPASAYTPHIYLSALPLSPPSSSVRSQYLPQFKGLIKVSGKIFDRMQKAAHGTWASTTSIRSAAFSPDGNRIIIGNEGGKISVHNAYDGKCIVQPFKAHRKLVSSIGISSDGMQIVSGSHDMTLSVWNTRDGSLISGPFKGHTNRVTSVAFSHDAAHIASGSDDCTVGIWSADSVATPMRSFTGHKKGVNSVAFSPDGSHIVSGSADDTVRLWELSSGATILILNQRKASVSSVQFSPDGTHIISGSHDCTIRIWNTSDGSLARQPLKGHSKRITTIAVSPDGDRIVSGSIDCSIRIWDTHSGELINGPFKGHVKSVRSVGFSSDGSRIISASDDKTVRVWNAQSHISESENDSKKDNTACKICASRSQTSVAFYGVVGSTKFHILDLRTIRYTIISTDETIEHLQFSLDGSRIHSLHTSGTICTWDTQTSELLDGPYRFTSFERWSSAKCSSDGTRVVTRGQNKFELWHVKSNRSIAIFDFFGHRIYFSQDGSRFTTSNHSSSDVWDGNSGAHVAGPFSAEALDFSPDGTYLCCLSRDNALQLIHVNTGERTNMPQRHPPDSVVFTPDSLYVATSLDSPIKASRGFIIDIWNICSQTLTSTDLTYATNGFYTRTLGSPSDGWLIYHNGEGGGYHILRIHTDYPPFRKSSDGWVLDGQKQPLIWVPTEIRESFPGCNGVMCSTSDGILQSVDYGDMLLGEHWSQCYNPNFRYTSNLVMTRA
ncbi:putative WD repeat-containing protein all2124 [Nostoc sp, PCC 7120] [Rhizoctonia solani]|uniref:Putative WD repeat-containing protein all2124 [Nostoc sp, PCC 7120] n=1 Tax=Rhizoctonia solani TaxID=456999 RepID=A0A0K6G855_9AGAM|nr:putative WD repeat-containing protein all2124 [Nostoc sp, PCC 7120] [Rhizoctonia solani]